MLLLSGNLMSVPEEELLMAMMKTVSSASNCSLIQKLADKTKIFLTFLKYGTLLCDAGVNLS